MNRIQKAAAREFRKLSKKEQKRINQQKRIPVPAPGTVFDKKKKRSQAKRMGQLGRLIIRTVTKSRKSGSRAIAFDPLF